MAGFELLEHTADVGIRARGATLEEAFEQATLGLAEVLGALAPEPGEPVAVAVSAPDPGGLLVDWLNEVLWLRETRDAWLAGVQVDRVGEGAAVGSVRLTSKGPAGEGDPGDPASATRFYMRVWALFFLEYVLVPAAAVAG